MLSINSILGRIVHPRIGDKPVGKRFRNKDAHRAAIGQIDWICGR